jgi:hypothetical protein
MNRDLITIEQRQCEVMTQAMLTTEIMTEDIQKT